MSEIAGFGAAIWRNGVKVDNIRQFTVQAGPDGSLKFEGATAIDVPPRVSVSFDFMAEWDDAVTAVREIVRSIMIHPLLKRELFKWLSMLARRERKRQRRYQRQKRKQ